MPSSRFNDSPVGIIVRWAVGFLIGTAIIAVTSPWFVSTYKPLVYNSTRNAWTLQPHHEYRFRGEGYATSWIGDHGMPGYRTTPSHNQAEIKIALWGDSQAEGVCVEDRQKLHRQIESHNRKIHALPLARSGEDMSVWLTQIPHVESELGVDAHVFFIVDIDDLFSAADAPLEAPPQSEQNRFSNRVRSVLPSFLLLAVKNVMFQGESYRKIRFSVGPVEPQPQPALAPLTVDWPSIVSAIRRTTDRPVMIAYAPVVPIIVEGNVNHSDRFDQLFQQMRPIAEQQGISVIDLRPTTAALVAQGSWPNGFHNGRIGSGHYNPHGLQSVASVLADQIEELAAETN